ncbi:phage portal protein [Streptomyces sp. NBC_01262]|uniref:phage portal protein n=1 Tax=Streptomyces sp. NBC_01262 TaxID=2903803 RepID=UPI002E33C3F1|nr:phage portal protein [Streptomyces sp. NBC_01262]
MSLFGLFEGRAGVENPAVPLTSASLLEYLGGTPLDSGIAVTERSSLHMPAVWRAISVVAGVASALPLPTYKVGTKQKIPDNLLSDPHPELTPLELWRLNYVHRLMWGNGYQQKMRNGVGQVKELWPISPDRVQVARVKPSDGLPGGKLFDVTDDWGAQHVLTSREILHIPGLGYDGLTGCSPIRLAAQGIGLAQAAEKTAARMFGAGNIVGGVLQTEQRLNADQADALKKRWQAKMSGVANTHEIAVLDSGASFQPVAMPNVDAQFLESREFQVVEVARMFGVPLFLLMETAKSTSWGTGLEQQAQGWVTFDLGPTWLTPTEQRINKELLPTGELYSKYQLGGLLRGDSAARATFYRAMRDVGAYSANDILDKEDMPPLEGPEGDLHLQPLYMAPLGSDPLGATGAAADTNAARAAALMAEAARLMQTPDETGEST